jgi:hypothetical protein
MMETMKRLERFTVFGNKDRDEVSPFHWEFIGAFDAESALHAAEQAKNAEPDKKYFYVAQHGQWIDIEGWDE